MPLSVVGMPGPWRRLDALRFVLFILIIFVYVYAMDIIISSVASQELKMAEAKRAAPEVASSEAAKRAGEPSRAAELDAPKEPAGGDAQKAAEPSPARSPPEVNP